MEMRKRRLEERKILKFFAGKISRLGPQHKIRRGRMRGRKWEELDMNCLALIFARLPPEDKVLSVPFVCKSWSRASLDPLCWRSLDFAYFSFWPQPRESFETRFRRQYPKCWHRRSFSGLLKLALHRSQGSTTELFLPRPFDNVYDNDSIRQEDLELVEKECLGIKIFSYGPYMGCKVDERITKMVANWENLETLAVKDYMFFFFEETLAAIKEHCPRFCCLVISGLCLGEEDTKAIVTHLPTLKRLVLRIFVDRNCLMSILDGCKDLEELHLDYCCGSSPVDDDVKNRAAANGTLLYERTVPSLRYQLLRSDKTDVLN